MQKASAKSLQYECLATIIDAFPLSGHDNEIIPNIETLLSASVNLVIKYLKEFVGSEDQNLKCLGLVMLQRLMLSYPSVVTREQSIIAACLTDEDEVIRIHAVKLIALMVQDDNLVSVVDFFITNLQTAKGAYRDALILSITDVASANKYSRVSDFAWYLNILVQLSCVRASSHSDIVASQIIDVVVRVVSIQEYAVQEFTKVLLMSLNTFSTANNNLGSNTLITMLGALILNIYIL